MSLMVRQTLEEGNEQRSWEFWMPGELSEEERGQTERVTEAETNEENACHP